MSLYCICIELLHIFKMCTLHSASSKRSFLSLARIFITSIKHTSKTPTMKADCLHCFLIFYWQWKSCCTYMKILLIYRLLKIEMSRIHIHENLRFSHVVHIVFIKIADHFKFYNKLFNILEAQWVVTLTNIISSFHWIQMYRGYNTPMTGVEQICRIEREYYLTTYISRKCILCHWYVEWKFKTVFI